MPLYEFCCDACKKRFEVFLTYTEYDKHQTVCLACGSASVQRVIRKVRLSRGDDDRMASLSDDANLDALDRDPKALGAAPTVMSSSEMYMALQRGTVDGATTGMPAAVSRKVHEVQKHMTMANYTTAQFVVQSSLDWWNGLPEEDKEVVMKAGADAEAWIRGVIAESEAEAEKVIADAGVEIYSPNDEERAAFVETTESVRKAFVEATGEMGAKLVELALEASK